MDGTGACVELVRRQAVLTEHCSSQLMCGRGGNGIAVIVIRYRGQTTVCVNKTWLTVERQQAQVKARAS